MTHFLDLIVSRLTRRMQLLVWSIHNGVEIFTAQPTNARSKFLHELHTLHSFESMATSQARKPAVCEEYFESA